MRIAMRSIALTLTAAVAAVSPLWLQATAAAASPPAAVAGPVRAAPGAGPAPFSLPLTSQPRHGRRSGQPVPVIPPSLKAGSPSAAPTPRAPRAALGGGTGPVATNLVLLPGLVVGDVSLDLSFDAPDPSTGWTQGVVSLYLSSDQSKVLQTGTFTPDLLTACGSPARFCWTLDNAHSWTLTAGTAYEVTVTLVATDGSKQVSAFSAPAVARSLPVPPPVSTQALRGGGGTDSTGRSGAQPVLRGVGVNVATGAFTQHAVDAALTSSYDIDVSAERTYSSEDTTTGLLGTGWTFSYEARVFPDPITAGQVVFRAEDGAEVTYTQQADGSYLPPAGVRSQLGAVTGGWKLVTPSQRTLSFDANGRLLSILNARGRGATVGYDAGGHLATVTDAGGRALKVTLTGGLITTLTLPDGRSVYYAYSGGRLHTVRNPDGAVITYDYDATGRLAKLTDTLGHVQLQVAYDATSGRVTSQTDHFGKQTIFAWDATNQRSTVTDPDLVAIKDHFSGNVLLDSQNSNGDANVIRYDTQLNTLVMTDPLRHQVESGFDSHGNLTSATLLGADPAAEPANVGLTEKATYDGANNRLSATDGRNQTAAYTYNQFNQVATVTDPEGNVTRLDYYPDSGLLHTVTDGLGRVTTYAYDGAGDEVSETDANGAVTTYAYDATGRVVSVVDPRGNQAGANPALFTSTRAYDGEDRAVRAVDPLGHTRLWSFDNAGRLHTYTDANTFATTYVYDDGNRLTGVTDPDLRTTAYSYTPGSRRASETDGAGDVTKYGYTPAGQIGTVTAPRGNVAGADPAQFTTTYSYDFNGNRTAVSRPLMGGGTAVTSTTYSSLNQPLSVRDPLARVSHTSYDAAGNRVSTTDPAGATQLWTFNGNNQVLTSKPASGSTLTSHYDAAGQLDFQQTALGEKTTFTYDGVRQLIARVSPLGNQPGADPAAFTTTFTYDVAGNQLSVTDPLGNRSTTQYDADNNATQTTDPDGHSTRYTYDAEGRVTTVVGPDGSTSQETVNTYDHDGNLITQVDPLGHIVRYTYDGAQRLTSSVDALGRIRKYAYDADGDMTTIETARATAVAGTPAEAANTITQAYDNQDRLVQRQLGTGGLVYAFGYDAAGQQTSLADPAGQQSRAYDGAGRLTSVSRSGATFGYGYDPAGRLTSRTLPDGSVQALGYDADSRPASLTTPVGQTAYAYDAASHLVDTRLPGGSEQKRTYDNAGRLAGLSDLAPGGGILGAYAVTRDRAGNPTRLDTTQAGATHSDAFTFDAANRLTRMCFGVASCSSTTSTSTVLSFTYDRVGNRLTKKLTGTGGYTQTYTYDAADELLQTSGGPTGTVSYGYDQDGNQVTAGKTHLSYGLDNRLQSVDDGKRKTVYAQDAAGNRLTAVTTPDAGGAAVTTSFQWDVNGTLPVLVSEQAGSTPALTFTFNPSGSPLSLQSGGASYLYQPDPFASTAELTDLAGTVQRQLTMTDPFGGFSQTAPGGSGVPDPRFELQGEYNDPLSGLYHLGARDYAPGTGRMQSMDPVLSRSPLQPVESSYVFANDNPLTTGDPSGYTPVSTPVDEADNVGDQPEDTSPWWAMWKPRHETAAIILADFEGVALPNYQVIREQVIPGGSANGNDGFADVVAFGSSQIKIWEVKHKGDGAETAGPAQLARYTTALSRTLVAHGDNRPVVPGTAIVPGLSLTNIDNPAELITDFPGGSAGIVVYTVTPGGTGVRPPPSPPAPSPTATTTEEPPGNDTPMVPDPAPEIDPALVQALALAIEKGGIWALVGIGILILFAWAFA